MQRLFRSFERMGLEYLLISGQASILYGAATFSEDIDLWVRPTPANIQRLVAALCRVRATIHKLTPPLTTRNFRFGHGFHFLIPDRPTPVYLDVMGRPPRVDGFLSARRRSQQLNSPWGRLEVVSIEDLVELKKTRRLSDYEVITNLVEIRLRDEAEPSTGLLTWAVKNSFRAETRFRYLRRLHQRARLASCQKTVLGDLQRLQTQDMAYWSRILRELRSIRSEGRLLPDGASVAPIMSDPGKKP